MAGTIQREAARMNAESVDVAQAQEPPAATAARKKPCDDCRHQLKCARESLGCHALILYMRGSSAARMAFAPRQPTRALWEQAMAPIKTKAPAVYQRPSIDE